MRSELGATTGGAGGVNAPAAADAEWQQLHLSPFDAVEQPGAEPLALKARHIRPGLRSWTCPFPPARIPAIKHGGLLGGVA